MFIDYAISNLDILCNLEMNVPFEFGYENDACRRLCREMLIEVRGERNRIIGASKLNALVNCRVFRRRKASDHHARRPVFCEWYNGCELANKLILNHSRIGLPLRP